MKGIWSIALLLIGALAQAQFSPGKLSRAHADLEGMSNCTKCHDLGAKVSDAKCLQCHEDLGALIDLNRGYHVSQEVQGKSCVKCHSEHHGRNFDLVRFDTNTFDHQLTGYSLEGAHQQVDCRKCHKPDYISDPEIAKRSGTYLGLEEACLSCHVDYHQETLGADCLACHRYESFEEAPGFDHQETEFPLRGAHQEVACLDCHPKSQRQKREYQAFSGIAFSACTDCHEDAHQGKFGLRCTDCHNEQSWSRLKAANRFDHDLTDYPLKGLHRTVACTDCHSNGDFKQAMAHQNCTDCHENYHKDDFEGLSLGRQDCSDCHSLDQDFSYSSYGLLEHDSSDFPLSGAHMATPCFACHKEAENSRWTFAFDAHNCVACHEDIHQGFISNKFYPEQDCEACHSTEYWADIDFDHDRTNWALEGAHATTACAECHFEDQAHQQFAELDSKCQTCHENSHGDQFGPSQSVDCTQCHRSAQDWQAYNFDHQKTAFPLEGRHAEIDCAACHKVQAEQPDAGPLYKIKKFECIDCHAS